MFKKFLSIIVCIAFIFVITTACGQKGKPDLDTKANVQEKTDDVKPITFTYATFVADGTQEIIGAAFAEYKKMHPELTMEVQVTEHDSYTQKMAIAANANTLPDLFWWNGFNLVSYIEQYPESMVDCTPFYDDEFKSGLLNGSLDLITTNSGIIAGFPSEMTVYAWIHNKPLFDEYGLEIPTTYKELKECISVFRKNGIDTFAFGTKDDWPTWGYLTWFCNWGIWEQGDDLYLSPVKIRTKDAGYVNAWKVIAELYELGAFPEHNSTMNFDQMLVHFTSGKAAIISLPSSQMGKLVGTPVEDDIVMTRGIKFEDSPFNQNIGIKTMQNGYGIGSSAAKDQDKLNAIVEFNKWRLSEEGSFVQLDAGFIMPVSIKSDISKYSPVVQQQLKLMGDETEPVHPATWSAYFRWDRNGEFIDKYYNILHPMILGLADGSKTKDDINNELFSKLDAVIDEAIETLGK